MVHFDRRKIWNFWKLVTQGKFDILLIFSQPSAVLVNIQRLSCGVRNPTGSQK